MKHPSLIAAAALGLAVLAPAQASVVGFTGAYAVGTWTSHVLGNVSGGGTSNGGVDASGAPNSLLLSGGNDATDVTGCIDGAGACEFQFTHAIAGGGPVRFDWHYLSNDSAGAQLDFFGLLVDGVHLQLSDPGGLADQSGSLTINPVSSFGWYLNCNDCTGGNAQATISGLVVPEPTSLALVGLGLLGAVAWRRRLPG